MRKSGLIFNSCRKEANIHNCDVAVEPHGLKFFSYKAIELDDIQLRFFFGLGSWDSLWHVLLYGTVIRMYTMDFYGSFWPFQLRFLKNL